MIRFPVDLRVKLMHAGIRLTQWHTQVLPMPEPEELDPEILRYRFESMHGILCFSPTLQGLTLVAVCNDTPGNGVFPLLMTIMEETAHRSGFPIIVGDIWNFRLRRHLIEKRGYKGSKVPGCEDAVIKPPRLTVSEIH